MTRGATNKSAIRFAVENSSEILQDYLKGRNKTQTYKKFGFTSVKYLDYAFYTAGAQEYIPFCYLEQIKKTMALGNFLIGYSCSESGKNQKWVADNYKEVVDYYLSNWRNKKVTKEKFGLSSYFLDCALYLAGRDREIAESMHNDIVNSMRQYKKSSIIFTQKETKSQEYSPADAFFGVADTFTKLTEEVKRLRIENARLKLFEEKYNHLSNSYNTMQSVKVIADSLLASRQ